MDLLDSILSKMDKPPTKSEEQKKIIMRQKQQLAFEQQQARNTLKQFRKSVENKLEEFAKGNKTSYAFSPMERIYNSIIQDVVETAGLQAYCFGVARSEDRYCVIYRKDLGPSQEEINARHSGLPWNDEIAAHYAAIKKVEINADKDDDGTNTSAKKKNKRKPDELSGTHYKAKYAHLIGETAALDAAKKTCTNKTYGEVPSENKKDVRSIEQTMADIQAKRHKKAKLDNN